MGLLAPWLLSAPGLPVLWDGHPLLRKSLGFKSFVHDPIIPALHSRGALSIGVQGLEERCFLSYFSEDLAPWCQQHGADFPLHSVPASWDLNKEKPQHL